MNLEQSTIIFSDLAKIWYAKSIVGVSYSHKNNLHCMINHCNNFFGNLPIQNIKPYHIDNMIAELAQMNPTTKRPTSKKTLKELIRTAYRIFDFAVENDFIIKNPAKNKCKDVPKNSPENEVDAIGREEQELILTIPHRCQLAALLMMLAGLRTSEVLALEWNDIDFDNKVIYIWHHTQKVDTNKFEVKYATKNKKTRYVTIPDSLCAFLFTQKPQSKSSLVFPKTDGTLHTPSSWNSAWRGYINSLNWEAYKKKYSDCKSISKFDPKGYPKTIKIAPHQLRHTYASLLYFSKVDPLTGSKLLGHATVEFTLNTYTHLDEEHKRLDISNFNDYLSSDLCNI